MSIDIVPFEAGLGAEIRGVDIRKPLSPGDRDAIRAAWLEHLVLRFRGPAMTDGEHLAFTRQFGELELNPAALIAKQYGVETQTAGRRGEVPPEISVISNIVENGKAIGGLGDGEAFWHTDSSFVDVPPAASLLRALECPPPSAGGSTCFLNMYSAYDELPAATKARIDGMTMIHAATHSSGGKAHKGFETVADFRKCRARASRWCALIRRPARRRCFSAAGSTPMCSGWRSRRARRCSTHCGRTRPRRNSPGARIGGPAILSGGTTAARCTGATPSTRRHAG